MDAHRAPQGLQAEDRVALGLSAAHLFYLVTFSLAGWAIISSHLPGLIALPAGGVLIGIGVALAWGRVAGRPLDRWVWLYGLYFARQRAGRPATIAARPPAAPAVDARELAGHILVMPTAARDDGASAAWGTAGRPAPGRPVGRGGAARRARRCAFFSYRGGTGKSALAAETAALLAMSTNGPGARETRVALLDLDVASSSLRIRLGIEGRDLGDLLSAPQLDVMAMESVLLRHESGVRVMLAPIAGLATMDAYSALIPRLAILLAYLDQQDFDVVLVDLQGIAGDLQGYVHEAVDDIYYVFSPTPCGVYDLYRGVASMRRAGHRDKLRLVLNHADAGVDLTEVFADLRMEPVAEIPTLPAIAAAEQFHVPAALADDFMGEALRDLVASVWPDAVFGADSAWVDRAVAGAGAGGQRAALRR